MSDRLVIKVCESCAWEKGKIRKVLKELRKEHGDRIKIVKKDCLDLCSKDPAVIVGKKKVAPAGPKKLLKAVAECL